MNLFSVEAFQNGFKAAHDALKRQALEQSWEELQAVLSYVERYADGTVRFDDSDVRYATGERCDSCNNVICTCGE